MKITIFFRSQEKSNAVVSSTKDKLQYSPYREYLDFDFINLDKKNYTKYFAQEKEKNTLPNIVFIWFDEEKITDYINEVYPNIQVYHFDKSCVHYDEGRYGLTRNYDLVSMIVEKFKDTLKKEEHLFVDVYTGEFHKEKFDEISLAEYHNRHIGAFKVNSKLEGYEHCLEHATKEVKMCEDSVEKYTNLLKQAKENLKKRKKFQEKMQKALEKEKSKV